MAQLDLNGLTQDEQFARAAEFAGVPESALRGQWRVESSNGTRLRSEAGARGHFQTMPDTQVVWEQREGRKFDPDNFSDSLTLAALTMKENMGLAKGDLNDALSIYHGGTNRKNWGERTRTYAGKVLGTNQDAAFDGQDQFDTTHRGVSFDAAWRGDPFASDGGAGNKGRKPKEFLSDIEKGTIEQARVIASANAELTGDPAVAIAAQASADHVHANLQESVDAASVSEGNDSVVTQDGDKIVNRAMNEAVRSAIDNETFNRTQTIGDKFGAAFSANLTAQTMRAVAALDEDKGYEGTWRYIDHIDELETPDLSARERSMLREATGPESAQRILREIQQFRHDARVLGGSGTVGQLAWGLAGGVADPVGWAAGFGVSKAASVMGVGTRAFIAEGRPIAALLSAGAEGAAGNLVTSAALDALGQYKTTGDYISDAGYGLVFGWALGAKGVRDAHMTDLGRTILREGAKRNVDLAVRAQQEAGPNATPEQLRKIIERLDGEDDARWAQAALGDIPDGERMFARPDVGERVVQEADTIIPERVEEIAEVSEVIPGEYTATTKGGEWKLTNEEVHPGIYEIKAFDADGNEAGTLLYAKDGTPPTVDVVEAHQRKGVATAMLKLAKQEGGVMGDTATGRMNAPAELPSLPKELKGAMPRYGYQDKQFNLRFASDVDRAAYIIAQKAPSKRDADYLKFVMEATGMTETQARTYGAQVREQIKQVAKRGRGDYLTVPQIFKQAEEEVIVSPRTEAGQAFRTGADEGSVAVAQAKRVITPASKKVIPASVKKATPTRAIANSVFKTNKAREDVYKRYGLREKFSDEQNETRIQVAEAIGRAERIMANNPIDAARLKTILQKGDLEATSTTLLSSESPVAKAVGIMLMENPEGAAGRRATASLDRAMRFEHYMGTTLRDDDAIYQLWRREQGIGNLRAAFDSDPRKRFDKLVAAEMDRRWNGVEGPRSVHPLISAAADVYHVGYKRMGQDQIRVGTVGAERIDPNRAGYFGRHWDIGMIANLEGPQRTAFLNMLKDQFKEIAELHDDEFIEAFAIKYLQRLEHRAAGLVDVPANLFSDDSAKLLRESLTALKMNEEEIAKVVQRFSRGGASHTKGRLDMDLNRTYSDGNGGTMTALDFINTNLPDLYRKYAARVAGEVALAKHGIMGEQGAKTLREALRVTGAKEKTELRAYDQFMAEMLGKPFGTGDNKYLANARVLTGSTRLGGALFPQLGAYLDATMAIGIKHTLASIFDIPRLHKEIRALSRGERVPNGILDGMETLGPDFGMSDYRIFGLYDVADATEIYGKESIGVTSRAIRGSGNAVRIMSGHRAVTGVQTRGMAEQIVQKAWRYIREGGEDKALDDMGISASLRDELRLHMADVIEWDASGNVKVFNPRNVKEGGERAMLAFRNSVWRGAAQIIQRDFPGETGKWAHHGLLKSLFQFRTFSLVAHQKQLGRQFAVHGTSKALGYMIGAMSFAVPIHMARVALKASLLPEDQRDKMLEEQLHPVMLARATMNYVGTLGILPDMLDAGGGIAAGWADTAGVDLPKLLKSTGGRTMANGDIIGEQFAPSLGVVNDLAQGVAGRPGKLIRGLPGNNLPYIQPWWLAAEANLKD